MDCKSKSAGSPPGGFVVDCSFFLKLKILYFQHYTTHSVLLAMFEHYVVVLASFVLGAVLIGLVLINHEHCVPGGGAHAH